jgi:modulator of FtsH protease HflC
MKRNLLTLAIGLFLILIVGLLLFVFQVRQSEAVVVTRFGNPVRAATDPGPHWRLPWPIENVYTLDQRVQNFEDRLTEGTTADKFILMSSVYVGWKITEPKAFLRKFFASASDPISEAEKTLKDRLTSAKSSVLGKYALSDLLAVGESSKFAQIEKEILAAVKAQDGTNIYGWSIEFLGIKRLAFPETVTQSVFERMKAERQRYSDQSKSEGAAEASMIKSEAETVAAKLLAGAKSAATDIRSLGEQETAKSLRTFQQNPEFAIFLLRLESLEAALKDKSTTLILDPHTEPFTLFQQVSTNSATK